MVAALISSRLIAPKAPRSPIPASATTAPPAPRRFIRRQLLAGFRGAVSGNFATHGLLIEPSACVYALWEREMAYVDSLGTMQAQRTVSTGRASGGVKVAYRFAWTENVTLTPYAGLYGDYYFNTDDVVAVGAAATQPVFDGWSARAMLGNRSPVRRWRTVDGRRRAQRDRRQLYVVDLSRAGLDPGRRAISQGSFTAQ